jgi:hypothetical protein
MSMGTTKMKMKDLGEGGGGRNILLAHLYKAAESHRGSYPTHPRSQTIRFPSLWLGFVLAVPSAERQR